MKKKFSLPPPRPLRRDKQIRLNKLERVLETHTSNHRELLKITTPDLDIFLHKE